MKLTKEHCTQLSNTATPSKAKHQDSTHSNSTHQRLLILQQQACAVLAVRDLLTDSNEMLEALTTDPNQASEIEQQIADVNAAHSTAGLLFQAAELLMQTGQSEAFSRALSGPAGELLFKGGELTFSQPVSGALTLLEGVATANSTLQSSPLQTTAGKQAHATLAGGTVALSNANPVVAVVDALLPQNLKPSTTLKGGVAATAALTEGLLTDNETGMVATQQQLSSGEHGYLLKEASQAGEFWARDGAFSSAATELEDWWSHP